MPVRVDAICSLDTHNLRPDNNNQYRCPHRCEYLAQDGYQMTLHLSQCERQCRLRRDAALLRRALPSIHHEVGPRGAAGAALGPDGPGPGPAPGPAVDDEDAADDEDDALPAAAVDQRRLDLARLRPRLPRLPKLLLACGLLVAVALLVFDIRSQYQFQRNVFDAEKEACVSAYKANSCGSPVRFAQARCEVVESCILQPNFPVQLSPIVLDIVNSAGRKVLYGILILTAIPVLINTLWPGLI